ncbi:PQQ-binding-like beta-propeller repeat protein [Halorussus sp. MSC15.2]|uniref:outer membrane protein assembly factor BamB family protein n=1 Tax=Halorussus sp. MSC15.2 TaxID=2283638 RepID=UPI0013D6E227|nr:PQQ-binding-like beta-propeller repeat protein [Halorussus sp. MSC15.2]NEU58171.1 PQQ-binding-like beta-propeller repeat protein [Halorussus sp. MSC15.2]
MTGPSSSAGVTRRAFLGVAGGSFVLGRTGVASAQSPSSPDGRWSMFGGDTRNSSATAQPGPTGDLSLRWTLETGGEVWSSPAVADGTVFVGSDDGRAYAVDATTGDELWRFDTGKSVGYGSPAVADGTVFVPSQNGGSVVALDAETGDERWRYSIGPMHTDYYVHGPTVADGTVYVGNSGGSVNGIDAETGEERWLARWVPRGVRSTPAVVGDTVYAASINGREILALDAATGERRWVERAGEPQDARYGGTSSPAVAGDAVYVGRGDGQVVALSAADGSVRWRTDTDGPVDSSPAVADGTVYVGSYDENVYALDATDGTIRWTYRTGGEVLSSPAVADGVVYVGSGDGVLYALDAGSGEEVGRIAVGTWIRSSPAVVDGTVYVGSDDGCVYAIAETDNRSPDARFDHSPDVPNVAEPIVFDGSRSNDPDGAVEEYAWNFGSGPPDESGQRVTHSYGETGEYEVDLTVTDDDGATDTVTRTIRIQEMTEAIENFRVRTVGGRRVVVSFESDRILKHCRVDFETEEEGIVEMVMGNFSDGEATADSRFRVSGRSYTSVPITLPSDGTYEVTLVGADAADGDSIAARQSREVVVPDSGDEDAKTTTAPGDSETQTTAESTTTEGTPTTTDEEATTTNGRTNTTEEAMSSETTERTDKSGSSTGGGETGGTGGNTGGTGRATDETTTAETTTSETATTTTETPTETATSETTTDRPTTSESTTTGTARDETKTTETAADGRAGATTNSPRTGGQSTDATTPGAEKPTGESGLSGGAFTRLGAEHVVGGLAVLGGVGKAATSLLTGGDE